MEIVRLQKDVAVLVDGEFFLERFGLIFGNNKSPREVISKLEEMVRYHLAGDNLYRIFFYDHHPYKNKEINPISSEVIDFSQSESSVEKGLLFEGLKSRRKMALRISDMASAGKWELRPEKCSALLGGDLDSKELSASDLHFQTDQKGTDMKIGVDVATLTLKKLVNKIILIAGDSDFVPAAKLARNEGVDFVLDPMWSPIKDELYEHIDGLKSVCPRPGRGDSENYNGNNHHETRAAALSNQ